jgi:hypothetical protein
MVAPSQEGLPGPGNQLLYPLLFMFFKEGNLKWVSLMLWAGADPYAKAPDSWHEELDPIREAGITELDNAANMGVFHICMNKYKIIV